MRKYIFLILLSLPFIAVAQTLPYSQYVQNYIHFNPAYVGHEDGNNIYLGYRQDLSQLAFFNNRYFAGTYSRTTDTTNSGIGVSLVYENALGYNVFGVSFAYSYNVELSEDMYLKLGGTVGLFRKMININNWQIIDSSGTTVISGSEGKNFGALNFGLLIEGDKFVAGISGINLNRPRLEYISIPHQTISREYFLMAAYKSGNEESILFIPSLLIRQREGDRRTGLDLNAQVSLYNSFLLGAGFKTDNLFRYSYFDPYQNRNITNSNNSLVGLIGLRFAQNYSIAFSFDYPLSNVRGTSYQGTAEGSLAFHF